MIFEKYKDLTPVQYKGAVEFDEIELKSRVKQFLLYEKSLRNLSQSELEDWLRIFKVSPTQNAQIQSDMDRYQKENKVRFRQSGRLAFAIKKCMKLAYHKAYTGNN
jgi:DNA polymerase III sliding clamp (beta) subunit (PCNA family)